MLWFQLVYATRHGRGVRLGLVVVGVVFAVVHVKVVVPVVVVLVVHSSQSGVVGSSESVSAKT